MVCTQMVNLILHASHIDSYQNIMSFTVHNLLNLKKKCAIYRCVFALVLFTQLNLGHVIANEYILLFDVNQLNILLIKAPNMSSLIMVIVTQAVIRKFAIKIIFLWQFRVEWKCFCFCLFVCLLLFFVCLFYALFLFVCNYVVSKNETKYNLLSHLLPLLSSEDNKFYYSNLLKIANCITYYLYFLLGITNSNAAIY